MNEIYFFDNKEFCYGQLRVKRYIENAVHKALKKSIFWQIELKTDHSLKKAIENSQRLTPS